MWIGEVKLTCPESGYIASIQATERSHKVNAISGSVFHRDEPEKLIYKFEGVCGQKSVYWSPSDKEKKLLIDHSLIKEAYINYLPPTLRSELDSLRLWVPVVNAILKNDMATADLEKKKIEAAQRTREMDKAAAGKKDLGTYFYKDNDSLDGNWEFKDNISLLELVGLGKKKEEPVTNTCVSAKEKSREGNKDSTEGSSSSSSSSDDEDLPENPPRDGGNSTDPLVEQKGSIDTDVAQPQQVAQDPAKEEVKTLAGEEEKVQTGGEVPLLDESTGFPEGDIRKSQAVPAPPITLTDPVITTKPSERELRRNRNSRSITVGDDGAPQRSAKKLKESEEEDPKDRHTKRKELKKVKREIIKKIKEQVKQNQSQGLMPEKDIIKAGTVKIRNSFKKWNYRWVVLMEGKLIYFTTKADFVREICRGIVMLKGCYAVERPSKKEGFCIKIYSVYKNPIYSRQDLRGRPINRALGGGSDYCLLRLKTKEEGKEWLKCLAKATPDFEQNKQIVSHLAAELDTESSDGPDDAESDDPMHCRDASATVSYDGPDTPKYQNSSIAVPNQLATPKSKRSSLPEPKSKLGKSPKKPPAETGKLVPQKAVIITAPAGATPGTLVATAVPTVPVLATAAATLTTPPPPPQP